MRTQLILITLLAGALSGCFGIPDDAADYGDLVSLEIGMTDVNGEAMMLPLTAQGIPLGMPGGPLGGQASYALRGAMVGESVKVDVEPGHDYDTVRVANTLDEVPAFDSNTRTVLSQFTGTAADQFVVGNVFGMGGYIWRVTAVVNETEDDATIEFAAQLPEPRRDELLRDYGGTVVSQIIDGKIVRTVEPKENHIFVVQGEQHPLGLEPGVYRQLAAAEGQLQLAKMKQSLIGLLDEPATMELTIVAISKGNAEIDQQILGNPTSVGAGLSPRVAS